MVSLKLSLSRSTSNSSMIADDWEEMQRPSTEAPPKLEQKMSSAASFASSSSSSLANPDIEDVTITVKQQPELNGSTSIDDLRLLAISTNMTELSYNISDIQTRIFEIQELRHQSQSSQNSSASNSSSVDQALMNLDERLESVSRGMKAVADALGPLLSKTPKQNEDNDSEDERSLILRKHAALAAEWESVQSETDVLREELKEDKWLTVFRTVSEQADGMMSSLEKAVKRCQEFIWRVKRNAPPETPPPSISASSSRDASAAPLTYETFAGLLDSFEAKKKHYMPATSKVLSIIDKGVQDRVTKNGECLRRHAESTQRWRNLRERIARTDSDMENIRRVLLNRENESTEAASIASEQTSKSSGTKYGDYPATPPSEGQRGRTGTLTRSMSPFRKLAKRLGRVGGRGTPTQTPPPAARQMAKVPSSDPVPTLKHRKSMFPLRGVTNLITPERPTHKYSQSFTPDTPSTHSRRGAEAAMMAPANSTSSSIASNKGRPKWNSSTKVEPEEAVRTIKPSLQKRTSSANLRSISGNGVPPVPPIPRSVSRSSGSFASSRPWSPITASQTSTTRTSISRPPSRSQSPSNFGTSPRTRPKTPSHIPTPVFWRGTSGSSEASLGEDRSPPSSSIMQRLSPTPSSSAISGVSSYSRAKTPLGSQVPYPRPPSRSMIPIPKFQVSTASRPSSAMSDYDRPDTSMSFRTSAFRAQTPEHALRSRVSQLPYYDSPANSTSGVIPPSSISRRASRLPPSSFRDSSATPSSPFPRTPSGGSRPASRSGAYTPSLGLEGLPEHKYVPSNPKDPLEIEIATVVNSIPHGLLVERIDPPLRTIPKENEEVKAQYAFTNQIARKVVVCRLLTMSRSGVKSKKVMCRVGGGWQDLQLYILNRQAGI